MVGEIHTNEDLKEMQSWSLDRKVMVAQTRIVEWYTKWNGQVYVSFSGGKDSTVLLDLTRRIYPGIEAVFCDTGLEYPEIKRFVKTFDNVTLVRPEMSFREVIGKYGYPVISKEVAEKIYNYRCNPTGCAAARFDENSEFNLKYKGKYSMAKYKWLRDSSIPISHKCCDVMKKRPLKKFEKDTSKNQLLELWLVKADFVKPNG